MSIVKDLNDISRDVSAIRVRLDKVEMPRHPWLDLGKTYLDGKLGNVIVRIDTMLEYIEPLERQAKLPKLKPEHIKYLNDISRDVSAIRARFNKLEIPRHGIIDSSKNSVDGNLADISKQIAYILEYTESAGILEYTESLEQDIPIIPIKSEPEHSKPHEQAPK